MGFWFSNHSFCQFYRITGMSNIILALPLKPCIKTELALPLYQFSSDEKAKEIEAFFSTRIKPSISRTLKQSLERVGNNARWINYIKNDKELGEVVRELAYRKY